MRNDREVLEEKTFCFAIKKSAAPRAQVWQPCTGQEACARLPSVASEAWAVLCSVTHTFPGKSLIYLNTPLHGPPWNIISRNTQWEALGNKSQGPRGRLSWRR